MKKLNANFNAFLAYSLAPLLAIFNEVKTMGLISTIKNRWDDLSDDERGQGRGGLIKTVFVGVILIAVMGWVANIVLNMIPAENDTLNVIDKLKQHGPNIVMILVLALFVLGVSALLRYLGVV